MISGDDAGVSSSDPDAPRRSPRRGALAWQLTSANRYGLVLILLAATYVVSVAVDGSVAALVVVFIQLATVWLAFTVSESYRSRRLIGAAIVLIVLFSVAGGLLGYTRDGSDVFSGLVYTVNAALYLIAPVLIGVHLVRRKVVDAQTLLGAIAAYVMIGMMFAFSYRAIGEFQSGPFFGGDGEGSMADDLFFSFITLTTTGYGNLVPAENPGQSLAVLEAVTGQLFLVTAVAKVVASWQPRGRVGP